MSEQLQLQCVNDLRNWVENEAEFYGRTDDEFLLIFLRGCKFNLEQTKKKLRCYYENRKKVPQWWANRDLTDATLLSLAQYKLLSVLINNGLHQPTVSIFTFSRFGPNLGNFEQYIKLISIIVDILIRQHNCQMNGHIMIVDTKKYPLWVVPHFISPIFIKNIFATFVYSAPVRVKKIILLNMPAIGVALCNKLFTPLLSQKLKQRFIIYGSDWSTLYDHVPRELLPEEYGGTAGPIKQHDDELLKKIVSFTDYIADDNKYGFP